MIYMMDAIEENKLEEDDHSHEPKMNSKEFSDYELSFSDVTFEKNLREKIHVNRDVIEST